MSWRMPLTDVRLSDRVIDASLEALRSNWLTMGPRTQDLERRFADRHGAAHAVALSSGGAALHLAGLAAGVGPGDEVIVPAMGFVADAHVAHWCGGRTVFADIESAERPLLDPDSVAARVTDRTRAVLAIHMFGFPCDLAPLREICAERGIALIEDCCESVGATLADGSPVGTGSLAGCFSFFAKTQLPVGEGGIILTDDAEAAERIRLLRSHAMTAVTWDRHRGHAETYDIVDLGFNYRIDEPRAAMARAHLEVVDEKVGALRAVAIRYREALGPFDGVEFPFSDDEVARSGHYAFPVTFADTETRDRVRAELLERRIQTTCYPSVTTLELYREQGAEHPCPRAEDFAARQLALPLSTAMTPADVEMVCEELAGALDG